MAIPLENVYYLLCYAWNRLDARDRVDVSAIPGNRIENLLAKVLIEGTGAYTTTYSTVAFNGFPPLRSYVI